MFVAIQLYQKHRSHAIYLSNDIEFSRFIGSFTNAKFKLLRLLGLKHYSPLAIVKKTRGLQNDDFYWMRFKGDTVTWDEIKLKD